MLQVRSTALLNQTHQFHGPRALADLARFTSARSALAEKLLPQRQRMPALPVLYLFSGVDLPTNTANALTRQRTLTRQCTLTRYHANTLSR